MFIPMVFVIIAILIAVSYSLVVHSRAPHETWSWYHSLASTLVSVTTGVAIVISIFYYQTEVSDNARKSQPHKLLSAEISDSLRILEGGESMNVNLSNSTEEVTIVFIQPLVLEDAFRSGLFNPVDSENMIHLARKIRMYNLKVSYLISVISSGANNTNSENVIRHAVTNVEKSRKTIIEASSFLLKQMELPLSPSVKLK